MLNGMLDGIVIVAVAVIDVVLVRLFIRLDRRMLAWNSPLAFPAFLLCLAGTIGLVVGVTRTLLEWGT